MGVTSQDAGHFGRPIRPRRPAAILSCVVMAVAGCAQLQAPPGEPPVARLQPLPEPTGPVAAAPPRVNGSVGTPSGVAPAQLSFGTGEVPRVAAGTTTGGSQGGGDVSLDFADTDIREAAAQILGNMLKVNYTIDPAVRGTATLRTVVPLTRSQLLPTLQALLAQNGATVIQSGSLYRVVPAAAAGGALLAGGDSSAGSTVVALRYASADDLSKVLAPFVGAGGRVLPAPAQNALIVTAEPSAREALLALIAAFDVDTLAGQSYALLPVGAGDARDFATALQEAFRTQGGTALSSQLRVVPMERVNAVLVVTSQPRFLEDARRVFALVDRARRDTVRSWHVYYLQNSRSNDVAYVLQQAFTPGHVTAQPSQSGATAPGFGTQQMNSGGVGSGPGPGGAGGSGGGGLGGSVTSQPATAQAGIGQNGSGSQGGFGQGGGLTQSAFGQGAGGTSASANPLLGGLDQSAGADQNPNAMRIIPNDQNNAILVYATPNEEATVDAMLRKIDIMPLQVRIDATIAEVTLNDQLQYGTQFYFKSGGINALLTNASTAALQTSFPGFVLSGHGNDAAPIAISALQAVTTVHVLSSPELLVLDNQPARLQVGNLVPYLTSSSQSTITSNAPVINSIDYRETGVIMEVIPRVSSGGLVTMDISQEVSSIDTTATATTGINSPTFQERNVRSRVVVQDGQTIGLAGLIQDSISRGSSGLPWLKDVPILGLLAGTQTNTRARTELLVLITPHVIHDARDARQLTEDMREQLGNAALIPTESDLLRPTGSADPSAPLRRKLDLGQ
jgi:general secretion pathway protein D